MTHTEVLNLPPGFEVRTVGILGGLCMHVMFAVYGAPCEGRTRESERPKDRAGFFKPPRGSPRPMRKQAMVSHVHADAAGKKIDSKRD